MRPSGSSAQTFLLIWQTREMTDDLADALEQVGPRLRELRRRRGTTLTELSAATGISTSTLSRLESGGRKPTLELLLPLARAHGVQLDDLVGGPPTGDPRVHLKPVSRNGMTLVPLSRHAGGVQAFKIVIPPRQFDEQRVHEGYDWLYVLSGRLRLLLGDREVVLGPGEAAEFDTRVPHWFGPADDVPVEVLSLFGPQGERMHTRAKPGAGQSARHG